MCTNTTPSLECVYTWATLNILHLLLIVSCGTKVLYHDSNIPFSSYINVINTVKNIN